MGPAEIVASLKELCVEEGPKLTTDRIVRWIERQETPSSGLHLAENMTCQCARLFKPGK